MRWVVSPLSINGASVSEPLLWKLFFRKRASATQGVPPGKDDLKWVANTTTVIHGEHEALLVDTFLSDAQTAELADWIASTGKRLSTIYITHAHPDHFFGLKLLRDRFPGLGRLHCRRWWRACIEHLHPIPSRVGGDDSQGRSQIVLSLPRR